MFWFVGYSLDQLIGCSLNRMSGSFVTLLGCRLLGCHVVWLLTHSLTHSHSHSLTLSLSLTHSLTHSLTQVRTGALIIAAPGFGASSMTRRARKTDLRKCTNTYTHAHTHAYTHALSHTRIHTHTHALVSHSMKDKMPMCWFILRSLSVYCYHIFISIRYCNSHHKMRSLFFKQTYTSLHQYDVVIFI